MRIGNEKHELILKKTVNDLRNQGYNVIRLDGKSPSVVAMNDVESIAIVINKDKVTNKSAFYNRYYMFSKVDFVINDDNIKDISDFLKCKYKNYALVKLNGKSPDAIAFKNSFIYAIEILGKMSGYVNKKPINDKCSIYDMFDGLMIKTFDYDSDDVFVQTFGRYSNEFR